MPTSIDRELLARWPLPAPTGSKYDRGQVLVVGGSASAPGAAMLAGVASLRAGAGRLTLAVADAVAAPVAVALPECAVVPWGDSGAEASRASAVLIGPGLDDPDETAALVDHLATQVDAETVIVLDAFALGVLPRLRSRDLLAGRLVLTPNREEAAILLGRELGEELAELGTIAKKYGAVVSCFGHVAAPDSRVWIAGLPAQGLGTSGSGDVLAGAITGLAARAEPDQAAVWGTWAHLRAGQLAGAPGYLARELADALPRALA